jgi:hypothetical protein
MNIGKGVQAILRVFFKNLKSCNGGTLMEGIYKVCFSDAFMWHDTHTMFHEYW